MKYAGGSVAAVDYSGNNGSSFDTYYYVRNAQNDIVKLIDGSGDTVIEYTYDSWGKVIAATSSLTGRTVLQKVELKTRASLL